MLKNYFIFAALFLPFTVFTKEIGMFKVGTIDIDIISYPFFILSFVLFFTTQKILISKKEAFVFFFILLIAIVNILLFDLPFMPFFKQYLPLVIFYFVTKTIMTLVNPIYIFEKYVDYAIIAAWIGIAQFLLKFVGIRFLTPFPDFFIDSVALEPSHYIVMILPAFIYFYEKKIFNWKFFLLLLTLVLTFKLTGLLAFTTYYFIRNIKRFKTLVFVMPFIFFGLIYIINNNADFEKRVNSAVNFTENKDIGAIDNLTTFSFISNLQIAEDNFLNTYGVGIGLGGHETIYIRNFSDDIFSDKWYGTNMKSAHCLLIRIMSELGVPGFFVLFMLFYKTFKIKQFEYQVVAWASLSHFVVKFFKIGSYFDYGTIFFLVMIITVITLDKRENSIHQKVGI